MNTIPILPFTETDLSFSIPQRFQQMQQWLPVDHLAYVSSDETLTYQALATASQSVATALMARLGNASTRAEQKVVGLLLPHSAAVLTAMLGTLAAGHFYLPLDFAMGENTVQQILRDCLPPVIVTTTALSARLASLLAPNHQPAILCIDKIEADHPRAPVQYSYGAEMYAALQYTSGSTGKPRGIIRTHATNLHSAYLAHLDFGLTPGDHVSHLLSYTHASSTPSIFGSLLNGATIYGQSITTITTVMQLYQWLQEKAITCLNISVDLLRRLAELAEMHPPLITLRTIVTFGEPMKRHEIEQLGRLLAPDCKFIVRLASTEAGTYARFIIQAGKPWSGASTPAGYVPPGQRVMILDENQQPVPAGQPGEIVVRSRFLCAGYWNQPEETALRFLPDPDNEQQQIFLTGDMGRMSADGLVEHVGRKDFMVKIRGYRVQLEEVEAALTRLPIIDEATVVARPTSTGEKQLIAYYTTASTPLPTADALRRALLTTLPDYMAPARFVRLDALPRTAIGKVDRAALPPPGTARPTLGTPFVAPQNEQEQQIADLWAELLEMDAVGIDDNFFELGGDSLTLLRMSALLTQRLGYTIPNRYYTTPTIHHLVQCLDGTAPTLAETPSLLPKPTPPPRPFHDLYPTTRLGKAIVLRGPHWRGLRLPYATGTTLQRILLQQPIIRNRVFKKQQALLTQVFRDAGIITPNDHLTLNLMTNTWRGWRKQAFQSPVTFARSVSIQGEEALYAGVAAGRGVIIVFVHQNFSGALTKRVLLTHTSVQQMLVITGWHPDDITITGLSNQMRRTQSALAGLELLQRGQAILIAGDGRATMNSLPVPFYGRQLPLARGIALLAQLSQAAVVAVFADMDLAGHISLEFVPLPTPTPTGDGDELLYQYADLLTARWPKVLTMMEWTTLQHRIDAPAIPNSSSVDRNTAKVQ